MNLKGFALRGLDDRDVEIWKVVVLLMSLFLLWPLIQRSLSRLDGTAGYVDPGILLLMLLGLICFLGILALCGWLFKRFLLVLGLPATGSLVLRFNELELWQKLGFYYAVFALLLLAGVGCFVAVL